MSFSLIDSCYYGCPPRAVNFVLVLMATASFFVIVERLLAFRMAYPLRSVRESGLDALARGVSRPAALRAMERAARSSHHELSRGVRTLLTVGLAAPAVGGLGAVSGFLHVARVMALTGSNELDVVSAGIVHSLIPFALGLFVGLLSYLGYSYFCGRLRRLQASMGRLLTELAGPRPTAAF